MAYTRKKRWDNVHALAVIAGAVITIVGSLGKYQRNREVKYLHVEKEPTVGGCVVPSDELSPHVGGAA